MAKTFLITYDLKKPGQNYAELYNAIKSLGNWMHPLESTWVVKVNEDVMANDIYVQIHPTMDETDFLLVVDITDREYQGWLQKNFWTWLKGE